MEKVKTAITEPTGTIVNNQSQLTKEPWITNRILQRMEKIRAPRELTETNYRITTRYKTKVYS